MELFFSFLLLAHEPYNKCVANEFFKVERKRLSNVGDIVLGDLAIKIVF